MRKMTNIKLVAAGFISIALALLLPCLSIAGSLEPSDPPGPTMNTLDDIYKKTGNVTRFPQCDGRRFLDMLDGTVADCETGLIWMKNANCFGYKNWYDAKSDCSALTDGNCSLHDDSVAGDWRLPSIRELESLVNKNYISPALSNAAGDGQWVEGDAFISVQSGAWQIYWSATTVVIGGVTAWYVQLEDGQMAYINKSGVLDGAIWCVRGGQGVAPL